MPYLCDVSFIFSLIFNVINHVTSFKQCNYIIILWLNRQSSFFVHFLESLQLFFDDNVEEESE